MTPPRTGARSSGRTSVATRTRSTGSMQSVITPEVYESLHALIEYVYSEEHKHWQESGRPAAHIFHEVARVADWLDTLTVPRRGAD